MLKEHLKNSKITRRIYEFFLVFYQHIAWFISLSTTETCGLLLNYTMVYIYAKCTRNLLGVFMFYFIHFLYFEDLRTSLEQGIVPDTCILKLSKVTPIDKGAW